MNQSPGNQAPAAGRGSLASLYAVSNSIKQKCGVGLLTKMTIKTENGIFKNKRNDNTKPTDLYPMKALRFLRICFISSYGDIRSVGAYSQGQSRHYWRWPSAEEGDVVMEFFLAHLATKPSPSLASMNLLVK